MSELTKSLCFFPVIAKDHEWRGRWITIESKYLKNVIVRVYRIQHLQGKQVNIWAIVAKSYLPSSVWSHLKN